MEFVYNLIFATHPSKVDCSKHIQSLETRLRYIFMIFPNMCPHFQIKLQRDVLTIELFCICRWTATPLFLQSFSNAEKV